MIVVFLTIVHGGFRLDFINTRSYSIHNYSEWGIIVLVTIVDGVYKPTSK